MDHKVSQQINDIVGDNVKKLAQVFPSVVKMVRLILKH